MSSLSYKPLPATSHGDQWCPKGLVIVLDGDLCLDPQKLASGSATLSSLNDFIRHGCCGFLLPHSSGLLLQQLLHCDGKRYLFPGTLKSARIAMLSNCEDHIRVARDTGISVVQHLENGLNTPDGIMLLASDICNLLGLASSASQGLSCFDRGCSTCHEPMDLVIVVIKWPREVKYRNGDHYLMDELGPLIMANMLIEKLDAIPGLTDTILCSLIVNFNFNSNFLGQTFGLPLRLNDEYRKLRPAQSFEFSEAKCIKPDLHKPALLINRLVGIIRIDSVDALDLDMISAKGGNACILAERFLPEIAYKIGYAPKYGA